MSICGKCDTPSQGESFCKNCGAKLNDRIASVDSKTKNTLKKIGKGRITLLTSGVAVALLLISYFVYGFGKEDSPNKTTPVGEVAVSVIGKEASNETKKTEELESTLPLLEYQTTDILNALIEGNLTSSMHLGSTREELVDQIGPAIVEYYREGESRLDYADATYRLSPINGLVYSVLLLFDLEQTTDLLEIKDALSNRIDYILADSGKDETDLYYLSYGSEDSTIVFYSEAEQGKPIYKLEYSNFSIYDVESEKESKASIVANSDKHEVAEKSTVTLDEVQFDNPIDMTWVMGKQQFSLISEANENFFLFQSGLGLTSFYFLHNERSQITNSSPMDMDVCNDDKTVIYDSSFSIASNNFVSPIVMRYDAGVGKQTEIYRSAGTSREYIDSIMCDDRYIYYTLVDANEKKTTHAKVLLEHVTKMKPREMEFTLTTPHMSFDKNKNGVYTYLPSSKSLHLINPSGSTTNDITINVEDGIADYFDFVINDDNDWFGVYINSKGQLATSVNGKSTGTFDFLYEFDWYDNRHLVLYDNNELYLFDSETGQKRELASNIISFKLDGEDIYYQDMDARLFKLTRQ